LRKRGNKNPKHWKREWKIRNLSQGYISKNFTVHFLLASMYLRKDHILFESKTKITATRVEKNATIY